MKRVLLLVNARARSGSDKYEEIKTALEAAGHRVLDPPELEDAPDFRDVIRKHNDEADLVIVGGGDGTINCVLPALVETKLPLVVFPLGTANLLARSFNIKAGIADLLELLDSGEEVPIDLGMVNGIYFINVCGLGISTEVNRRVSSRLKKLTGPFSFWITGLKLRKLLHPFRIKLTTDDGTSIVTRTWQITICNGRKYAAWMTIEPDANYDDGTLRCLSTEVKKWWQGIKLLPYYFRGNYRDGLDVNFLTGKKIRLETPKPLRIDVDGDVQTTTPATFEIKPKAIKLILPKTLGDSLPIQG